MITVGTYNRLRIDRFVDFGAYLDDGDKGILLPKRFVPDNVAIDDELEVFIYHDSDNKLIATTQQPHLIVNEIAYLKCISTTKQGAFMDWGLMKDLFVPKNQQKSIFYNDAYYFVKAYIDTQTGRIAATEKWEETLSNEKMNLKELDEVQMMVFRESPLGYICIVNHQYEGLLHKNEVFKPLYIGESYEGFIKKIYEGTHKLDLSLGKKGYQKVEDEADTIIRLLNEHNGYLPYNDQSTPESIYDFFGMSKKTFKMTIGKLYKERKIELTQTGIKLLS